MKIQVVRRDGRIETLTLREGDWLVQVGQVLNMLSQDGLDHFFTKDGAYDGWGGAVPPGTSMDEAKEMIAAMEAKRVIEPEST